MNEAVMQALFERVLARDVPYYLDRPVIEPPEEIVELRDRIITEEGLRTPDFFQVRQTDYPEGVTIHVLGTVSVCVMLSDRHEANKHVLVHEMVHVAEPEAGHGDRFYELLYRYCHTYEDDPIVAALVEGYQPNPSAMRFVKMIDASLDLDGVIRLGMSRWGYPEPSHLNKLMISMGQDGLVPDFGRFVGGKRG